MRQQQAWLFLYFALLGLGGSFVYDWLRALRREMRHPVWLVIMEDSLFAAVACTAVYALFFWKNQGALRIYGLVGCGIGIWLYYTLISRWLLRVQRGVWRLMLFPIKWLRKRRKRRKKSIDEMQQME